MAWRGGVAWRVGVWRLAWRLACRLAPAHLSHEILPTTEATDHLFQQHLVTVAYHGLLQDDIVRALVPCSPRAKGAVCTSAHVPARGERPLRRLRLGLLGPCIARLGGGLVSVAAALCRA